ncbi:MAG TPA: hypothetical protein VKP30_16865, partial [Polyangiaceae bacterium]|nr:hypothetical protein [Polyangiaceae bacterium]
SHTGPHTVERFSTLVERQWHYDPTLLRARTSEFFEHPSNAHRSVWWVSFVGPEYVENGFPPHVSYSTQRHGIIGIVRVQREGG